MTNYIDTKELRRLIEIKKVETLLTELATYIADDYSRWSEFDKSARVASHSTMGVIELMPISDGDRYSFKYVNGHPDNPLRDMLTVMAFGVLADVATGYPLLLSELTLTTALRTAATSALVAKLLARPDSRSMALIGNGAQSEFQALAFMAMTGIREIRAYDVDSAATRKLVRNLKPFGNLRVIPANSIREAVRGADIVTTATADKTYATILTPDMIEPGMHLNALGGDCPGKTELHADILRHARVVVEYEPQTRVEGDIQQLPADFPVTEVWRILAGLEAGRENCRQVTVFDSVGFALEDFSALRYLLDMADTHALGQQIDLIPRPLNPKDLFKLLEQPRIRPSNTECPQLQVA